MPDILDFLKDLGPRESGDIARTRQLARELALGVHDSLWSGRGGSTTRRNGKIKTLDKNLDRYLEKRWQDYDLGNLFERLEGHGYMKEGRLSPAAFQLLHEAPPYNVFISYKRSESSALALLVQARLKEMGLIPFVDIAVRAGDNWKAQLHERVRKCDIFVLLVGRNTLTSTMTLEEIDWAIGHRKTIIPIWHNKFSLTRRKWDDLEDKYRHVIGETEAIRVKEESASGYNTAIVELLNRFGITP